MSEIERYFKSNYDSPSGKEVKCKRDSAISCGDFARIRKVSTDNEIKIVSEMLTRHFGKSWGINFDEQYVRDTKEDRFIIFYAEPLIHIRIMNRDIEGVRCMALSGLFKFGKDKKTEFIKYLLDFILEDVQFNVSLALGTASPDFIKYYVERLGFTATNIHFESHNTILFYRELNGFKMTDEILEKLSHIEPF